MIFDLNNPDHIPAAHWTLDVIFFRSGYVPTIGDTLLIGNYTAEIVEVYHEWDTPRNWRCAVRSRDMAAIREALTFHL